MKHDTLSRKVDNLPRREKEILDYAAENDSYFIKKNFLEKTHLDGSNVSRSLRALVKKGFLKRLDAGLYQVVMKEGVVAPPGQECYEGHGLQVEIHFRPDERKELFSRVYKSKEAYTIKKLKQGQLIFKHESATCHSTLKGLMYSFPTTWKVYAEDIASLCNEIYTEILSRMKKLLHGLRLNIDLEKGLRFEIVNLHIVHTDEFLEELLKRMKVRNITLIEGERGRREFIVDFSKGYREAETIAPESSIGDGGQIGDMISMLFKNDMYKSLFYTHRELFPDKENALSLGLQRKMTADSWAILIAVVINSDKNTRAINTLVKIQKKNMKFLMDLFSK